MLGRAQGDHPGESDPRAFPATGRLIKNASVTQATPTECERRCKPSLPAADNGNIQNTLSIPLQRHAPVTRCVADFSQIIPNTLFKLVQPCGGRNLFHLHV